MTRREYRGNAQSTTISAPLNIGDYTITVASLSTNTSWPTGSSGGFGPFFVVVNRGQNNEEKILCSSRVGATITVSADPDGRGADETSEGNHANNSSIEHVFTATDANEANFHIQDTTTTNVHGIMDTADLLVMDDPRLGTAAYEDVPFTAGNIAENAVTTSKIANLNVTTGKIADLGVTTGKIADLGVATGKIADLGVTTAKIAADAVTTAKIVDDAVTTAKIANDAVTTDQIANLAVTNSKIGIDAVTSSKIADGTIVDANINATANIDPSKISGLITSLDSKVTGFISSGTGTVSIGSGSNVDTVNITQSNFPDYPNKGFLLTGTGTNGTLAVLGVKAISSTTLTVEARRIGSGTGAFSVTFRWLLWSE